jgi:hypothetical protein
MNRIDRSITDAQDLIETLIEQGDPGDENDFTEEAEQRKDPAAVAQRSNASQGSGTSSINTLCRVCKTPERQAGDVMCGPGRFAQPLVTDRVCPSTQYSGL